MHQFKQPNRKKKVRAFLGLAGYYKKKIVPHFAEIAVPLTEATKKNMLQKRKMDKENAADFL